jgi:magnesium transporter
LIDGFLPQLFSISEQMDRLDEQILAGKVTQSIFNETLQCRHSIRILRSSLSPMQRIMRDLVNTRLELISDDARKFLTGLFEHMEWIAEAIDSLQESIFATCRAIMSSVSLQITIPCELLSIIATIMMPLSLITAIYGTNSRICRNSPGNIPILCFFFFCLRSINHVVFFSAQALAVEDRFLQQRLHETKRRIFFQS